MKRSNEALVIVPMLLVIAAMAILGLCGIARAAPARQCAFQVTEHAVRLPAATTLEASSPRCVS